MMDDQNREALRMDEVLRNYAGRRRHGFGPPRSMPAHVRSRLQREARANPPRSAGTPLPGWQGFLSLVARPWALGTAALVLVAAWVAWRHWPSPATEVASRPLPERAAPALTPPAAEGRPRTLPPTPQVDAGEPAPLTTDAFLAPRLTASPSPPAPNAERPERTRAAALPPSAATSTSASASAERALTTTAPSVPVRPSPVPQPEAAAAGVGREVRVRYRQHTAAPLLPVLNAFQLGQVGDGFQIVDEDGSVYRAELQVGAVPLPAVRARDARPVGSEADAALSKGPGGQDLSTLTTAAAGGVSPSLPQVIVVNAVGTNRGLRQRVLLAGNLVVTNLAGAPALENEAGLFTNQQALQFLFSNARFEGQAQVGVSNQLTILAVPSGP